MPRVARITLGCDPPAPTAAPQGLEAEIAFKWLGRIGAL